MIKNFDAIKAQLSELADVINAFKSEAVQLRIVELVLDAPEEAEQSDEQRATRTIVRKEKRATKAKVVPTAREEKKRKPSGGTGAYATLDKLAQTDFFGKSRTINDIIEHCKHNLARNFKANEFSGKLGRMVQSGQLTRKKNAEHQYEYKKP